MDHEPLYEIDTSDFDPEEFLPLLHEAMKEVWDAPGMKLYDNYDAHRPSVSTKTG
jgi:hypothetical protein